MEKEYIERGALLEELQEEIVFESAMYTEEQNKWLCTGLRIATRDVRKQPTADVVPRDEVAKIFEEIEEKIEKAAEVQSRIYYGGKRSSEDSCIYVSKISALRGIGIIVEELKEKYTKGGEGDG